MMTSKHTPGPWRVEAGTTLIWGACDSADLSSFGMGFPIAEARITPSNPRWAKGPNMDEGEANARLIAAAPEMLEALELIVSAQDTGIIADPAGWAKAFDAARAALARARGEG